MLTPLYYALLLFVLYIITLIPPTLSPSLRTHAGAQQADVSRTEGDGAAAAAANRQPAPAAGHKGATAALPQIAGGAQCGGQCRGGATASAARARRGAGVQAASTARTAGSSGSAEDLQCNAE